MRAARRQGVLGVALCGTGPSSRVRAQAPSVQHRRGGYKRGLHAFQSRRRHYERYGAPDEEKGGGGAGGSVCRREPVLATPLWCFTLTMPGSSRNYTSS